MKEYELLEAGEGFKWERFGNKVIKRPLSQGFWPLEKEAPKADLEYLREGPDGAWKQKNLPEPWQINLSGVRLELKPTSFGHLGVFPEHLPVWEKALSLKPKTFLNLFAYTGGASLRLAKAGVDVVHVDASKSTTVWAQRNAELNQIDSIRWIVEDVTRFVKRELRRERRYDLILLDPPSFGRGARQEVFKIEKDLILLLELCADLVSENGAGILLSCHTPGWNEEVLKNMLERTLKKGKVVSTEALSIPIKDDHLSVPCGTLAHWSPNG